MCFRRSPQPLMKGISDAHKFTVSRIWYSRLSLHYVRTIFENGAIIFRIARKAFSLMKLYNDRLSELRRQLKREAEGPLQSQILNGTR